MKECWVTEPLHFEMRETEIPEPKDNEVPDQDDGCWCLRQRHPYL